MKRIRTALFPVVVVLMVPFATLLVNSLSPGAVPMQAVVLILALIGLNSLFVCLLCRVWTFDRVFGQLSHILDKIRLAREELPLVDQDETAEIERTAQKVWVITKDFWWDLEDQKFAEDVVYPNIDKGVEYRYIYPNSTEGNNSAEALVRRLKEKCRASHNLLRRPINVVLRRASEDAFDSLIHEIVIYHESARVGGDTVVAIVDINGKRHESSKESRDLVLPYKKVVDRYLQMYEHLEGKAQERYRLQ